MYSTGFLFLFLKKQSRTDGGRFQLNGKSEVVKTHDDFISIFLFFLFQTCKGILFFY